MSYAHFFFSMVLASPAFPEIVKMNGTGQVIVGSDQTQVHGEALAFLKAKADAINKLGSYVESNIQMETHEKGGGITEITRSTIHGFTGGMVSLVEGTKVVAKEFKDEENLALEIRVSAQFQVNMARYREVLNTYASRRREKDALRSRIDAFVQAESEVLSISRVERMDDGRVIRAIEGYNASEEAVRGIVAEFDGEKILEIFEKGKVDRRSEIEAYLRNIASAGNPAKVWKLSIVTDPVIEDVSATSVRVKMHFRAELGREAGSILRENYKKYRHHIYRAPLRIA